MQPQPIRHTLRHSTPTEALAMRNTTYTSNYTPEAIGLRTGYGASDNSLHATYSRAERSPSGPPVRVVTVGSLPHRSRYGSRPKSAPIGMTTPYRTSQTPATLVTTQNGPISPFSLGHLSDRLITSLTPNNVRTIERNTQDALRFGYSSIANGNARGVGPTSFKGVTTVPGQIETYTALLRDDGQMTFMQALIDLQGSGTVATTNYHRGIANRNNYDFTKAVPARRLRRSNSVHVAAVMGVTRLVDTSMPTSMTAALRLHRKKNRKRLKEISLVPVEQSPTVERPFSSGAIYESNISGTRVICNEADERELLARHRQRVFGIGGRAPGGGGDGSGSNENEPAADDAIAAVPKANQLFAEEQKEELRRFYRCLVCAGLDPYSQEQVDAFYQHYMLGQRTDPRTGALRNEQCLSDVFPKQYRAAGYLAHRSSPSMAERGRHESLGNVSENKLLETVQLLERLNKVDKRQSRVPALDGCVRALEPSESLEAVIFGGRISAPLTVENGLELYDANKGYLSTSDSEFEDKPHDQSDRGSSICTAENPRRMDETTTVMNPNWQHSIQVLGQMAKEDSLQKATPYTMHQQRSEAMQIRKRMHLYGIGNRNRNTVEAGTLQPVRVCTVKTLDASVGSPAIAIRKRSQNNKRLNTLCFALPNQGTEASDNSKPSETISNDTPTGANNISSGIITGKNKNSNKSISTVTEPNTNGSKETEVETSVLSIFGPTSSPNAQKSNLLVNQTTILSDERLNHCTWGW